jgi:hypothetical protein
MAGAGKGDDMSEHTPGTVGKQTAMCPTCGSTFFLDEYDKDNDIELVFAEAANLYRKVRHLEDVNADLLKACKVALNAINLNDETVTARKALDAAIEKAEGKPTLWAKEMT